MTSKVWASITSILTYRTKALKEVVGFSVFTRCVLFLTAVNSMHGIINTSVILNQNENLRTVPRNPSTGIIPYYTFLFPVPYLLLTT